MQRVKRTPLVLLKKHKETARDTGTDEVVMSEKGKGKQKVVDVHECGEEEVAMFDKATAKPIRLHEGGSSLCPDPP